MKKNILNIITLVSVSTTLLLTSCDSGSDDGTVSNWFCALILLLAWMRGGK